MMGVGKVNVLRLIAKATSGGVAPAARLQPPLARIVDYLAPPVTRLYQSG
jgi:hypothetical protein